MTREEVVGHITLGRNNSVCVDISHVPELPSFVRHVAIYRNHVVWVSFYNYGYDEAGIRRQGVFESLDELIEELEIYLQKPLAEWHNFTKSGNYPEPIEVNSPKLSWSEIESIAASLFPKKGNFK